MQKIGMLHLVAGCSFTIASTLCLNLPGFAVENQPAPGAEGDVQSRGFSLPKVTVPPPPPPPAMQPLTVRTTGEGTGKVTLPPAASCPPGCTASYPKGTPVVIAAVPAPGSTFAGWGGACRGTAPCTIVMDGAKTVEAKFNKVPMPSVPPPTQWMTWSRAAANAARQEATIWLKSSSIDGAMCKINASNATAPAGVLKSRYNFVGLVKQALIQAGAPENIARDWDVAFKSSWDLWAANVTIPALPWYPSFAAWPGPVAPPTPNTASPLSALVSPRITAMTPPALTESLQAKLGIAASQQDAKTAILSFAGDLGARFSQCMAGCMVVNVMGSGPVPTFSQGLQGVIPGQVINGTCSGGIITVNGF